MKRRVRIAWTPKQDVAVGVRLHLPPLVKDYFTAGRAAARPHTSAVKLHQFRLATKRLRYTLELFQPLYGPGLAQRLAQLRTVQDLLGDAQDATVTSARIAGRVRRDPALAPVLADLELRMRKKQAEFRSFWTRRLDVAGGELRWTNYLRRRTKSA